MLLRSSGLRRRNTRSLTKMRSNFLAGFDERGDGFHRFLEHGAFGAVELNFNNPLDPLGADYARHADIEILDVILAIEIGGARQHSLLVLQIALRHGDGGCGRSVESRAALEQIDDLGAAVPRALDDGIEPRLRCPFHSYEIGKWNAGDGRI